MVYEFTFSLVDCRETDPKRAYLADELGNRYRELTWELEDYDTVPQFWCESEDGLAMCQALTVWGVPGPEVRGEFLRILKAAPIGGQTAWDCMPLEVRYALDGIELENEITSLPDRKAQIAAALVDIDDDVSLAAAACALALCELRSFVPVSVADALCRLGREVDGDYVPVCRWLSDQIGETYLVADPIHA